MSIRVLNKKQYHIRGMQNPTNSVVQCFRLGERLVTALMRKHPNTSANKAIGKAVQRPQCKTRERVEVGTRQANLIGRDTSIEEGSELVYADDQEQVVDTGIRCQANRLRKWVCLLTHSSWT